MHFPSPTLIPRFKSSLRVEAIDADILIILSERKRSIIRGHAITLTAAAIDGIRTVTEIADALNAVLPAGEVFSALEQLAGNGHLIAAGSGLPAAGEGLLG